MSEHPQDARFLKSVPLRERAVESLKFIENQESAPVAEDSLDLIEPPVDPGERVVMPPGWAHYVVNAETDSRLIFGAWCDRQYAFDYTQMRAHHGLSVQAVSWWS